MVLEPSDCGGRGVEGLWERASHGLFCMLGFALEVVAC